MEAEDNDHWRNLQYTVAYILVACDKMG